jgi:adenylate kinase
MTNKKVHILFLGAPGSGKGTQADLLSDKCKLPHIDMGGMLRAAVDEGTEYGKVAKSHMEQGKLVPLEIVTGIVKERLSKADCNNGFILDGYPRSLEQAEALDTILSSLGIGISVVLNIEVDEQLLTDRLVYRRSCANCGAKYNLKLNPPLNDEKCDKCDGELVQRSDDTEENAKRRFETYHKETAPLIEYYSKKGLLKNIDGNSNINQIFDEVLSAVNDC